MLIAMLVQESRVKTGEPLGSLFFMESRDFAAKHDDILPSPATGSLIYQARVTANSGWTLDFSTAHDGLHDTAKLLPLGLEPYSRDLAGTKACSLFFAKRADEDGTRHVWQIRQVTDSGSQVLQIEAPESDARPRAWRVGLNRQLYRIGVMELEVDDLLAADGLRALLKSPAVIEHVKQRRDMKEALKQGLEAYIANPTVSTERCVAWDDNHNPIMEWRTGSAGPLEVEQRMKEKKKKIEEFGFLTLPMHSEVGPDNR